MAILNNSHLRVLKDFTCCTVFSPAVLSSPWGVYLPGSYWLSQEWGAKVITRKFSLSSQAAELVLTKHSGGVGLVE